MLVDALAAKVLKRVKFIPSGISQPVPANVKTAAPETQRVMFFKNQDLFQAPAIRIYLFCQSSGWQVMRTQEQKEENTGKRQMQI